MPLSRWKLARLVARGLTRVRPRARGSRSRSSSRNSRTRTIVITSATTAVRWVTSLHSAGASLAKARAKAKTRPCQRFRHRHQPAVPLMWAVLEPAVPQETAIGGDGVDAGWILAIEPSFRNATLEHLYETAIDAFHEVLVDSGAERCVCPPFWARDAPHEAQLNPCLVTSGSSCESELCWESGPSESSLYDPECSTADSFCG